MRSLRPAVLALLALACRDSLEPTTLDRQPASASVGEQLATVYGPHRFTRGSGSPNIESISISTAGFEGPFVLHVRSGDAAGSHRVSSATILLDGAAILTQSDFNHQQSVWQIPVPVGATGELRVSVAGKPASFLEISLVGKRSAPTFCPGTPGAFETLQAAIDAAPAGGTVLVCDGIHTSDETVINKPLTLRSQNPGGATLTDAVQPPFGLQGGRPTVYVRGIVSGTVRIVDIAFLIRGRAIYAEQSYDQLVIDSVRFKGKDSSTATGVWTTTSSVPGATVEVINSNFDYMGIGIFAIGSVPTNVRRSRFSRFTAGPVTYSGIGNGIRGTLARGTAEDNEMTDCYSSGCIRIRHMEATVRLLRNRIVATGVSQPAGAIDVTPSPVSSGHVIIEDNEIISTRIPSAPANAATGWAFRQALNLGGSATIKATVRRNRIVDAFTAIASNVDADAFDNVITGGVNAFTATAIRTLVFQRNDVTGLLSSFTAPNQGGAYQCNWWGSPAGPTTPPANVPAIFYTPSASGPIAGTSLNCDPAANAAMIRVCATGGNATTLQQGIAMVATFGVVRVCDGVYPVAGLAVPRPMTIIAENPLGATLDAGSNGTGMQLGNIPPGGSVIIRQLRFVGGVFANVFIGNGSPSIQLGGNEFNPPSTGPYGGTVGWLSGVQMGGTGIGTVNLSDNTFIGGDVGYHVNSPSGNSSVNNNVFRGQNNSSVHIAGPKPGALTFNNNRFSDCGPNWCVFSQHATSLNGSIIDIDIARPTQSPIYIDNFSGGTSFVTASTIVGTGNGGADRSLASTYPIRAGAIRILGASFVDLNRITNAYLGVTAMPGTLTGARNIMTTVFAPFGGAGGSIIMTRNDITDYVQLVESPQAFSTLDFTCSYWGSPTGPTVGINVPASVYTPFVASPTAIVIPPACP